MARILIADDDEADRLVLRTILERADHEMFFAKDGEEALREYLRARIRAEAIEVVITDLQMPKLHGLELIVLLGNLSPRPAIIAISGTGYDQLDMAQAVGADATLTKPVDSAELLNAIAQAVTLAPDSEPAEEAMDLGALAPDPDPEAVEEVIDLRAPAPDAKPEAAEDTVNLSALTPDPEPEAIERSLGIWAALTSDRDQEAAEEATDISALAPDLEPESAEEAMDISALAPDLER